MFGDVEHTPRLKPQWGAGAAGQASRDVAGGAEMLIQL